MRYDDDSSQMIFSSGQKRYCHLGIIGLSRAELGVLEVCHGYDGYFWSKQTDRKWTRAEERLSPGDITELADYMIDLWRELKTRYGI